MSRHPPQHNDMPAIQEFYDWVDKNRVHGTLGSSNDVNSPFMPTTLLVDHLKAPRRLRDILTALFPQSQRGGWSHLPVTEEQVWQSGIVKILSIFILIGRGTYLQNIVKYPVFKDESLPYLSEPAHFPQLAHGDKSIWKAFYEMQFQFCPYEFKPRETGRNLEKATILPIIKKEQIDRGGSAAIYKIKLHAEYDQFQSHTGTVQGQAIASNRPSNTYILKSYYDNKDACIYYENEVKGFQLLGLKKDTQQCLVTFYGSFIYQGTYHVLLEYADRGTLEDYFHNIQPPHRAEDIVMFWKSLFQIIKALLRIHELKPSGGGKDLDVMQGWHQDVDPTNILVFSGQSSNPYDVQFKLSDLGLSHFQRFTDRNDTASDAWGTRMYGAPECYRWDDFLERCDIYTKPYVDIWSYGCVCSEAAMWIVQGAVGVDEYRSQRKRETDTLEDFRDGFAFHNAETVLRSVHDTHDEIRGCVRVTDKITVLVLNEIIAAALEAIPEERPRAPVLYKASERVLRSALRHITPAPVKVNGDGDSEPPHHNVAHAAVILTSGSTSPDSFESSASTVSGGGTSHRSHPSGQYYTGMGIDNVARPPSSPSRGSRADRRTMNRMLMSSPAIPSKIAEPEELSDPDISDPAPLVWRAATERTDRHGVSPGLDEENVVVIGKPTTCPNCDNQWDSAPKGFMCDCSYKFDGTESTPRQNTPPTPPAVAKTRTFTERSGDLRASTKLPLSNPELTPQQRDRSSNPFGQQGSNPRKPPGLSFEAASKHVKNHKKARRNLNPFGKKDVPTLTDESFLGPLDDRDFVFVIDNSETMLRYRDEIKELLKVLAWLIKKRDPDGYELVFTNSSSKSSQKYTEATPAVDAVSDVTFSGMADMDSTLDTVLKKYNLQRRNLCIYVFTNGIWQPGCTAEQPIRNLVAGMNRLSLPRNRGGIQFVQFGKEPKGSALLDYLDSRLGKIIRTEMKNAMPGIDVRSKVSDVVDTTPFPEGDVMKMLLGAISPWFDDDEEDNEEGDYNGTGNNGG